MGCLAHWGSPVINVATNSQNISLVSGFIINPLSVGDAFALARILHPTIRPAH